MYYNRNDRRVLLLLLSVILVCCVVFFVVGQYDTDNVAESLQADSSSVAGKYLSGRKERSREYRVRNRENAERELRELEALDDIQTGRAELFTFDPNTASADELLRLGLKPWQVRNLLKYRIRGGVFRQPEDFGKLYGLNARQYKTLMPYIRIDRDLFTPASKVAEKDPFEPVYESGDTFPKQKKITLGETVDIATADTTALKTVPGIGSYFARKIIRYRNQLGGYVSVSQLDEIQDFPKDTKKFFVVSEAPLRKIPVNKATLVQMKRHPYMGFFRAKTILDYRREHGVIHSLDDLSSSKYFTHDAIARLEPYVSVE